MILLNCLWNLLCQFNQFKFIRIWILWIWCECLKWLIELYFVLDRILCLKRLLIFLFFLLIRRLLWYKFVIYLYCSYIYCCRNIFNKFFKFFCGIQLLFLFFRQRCVQPCYSIDQGFIYYSSTNDKLFVERSYAIRPAFLYYSSTNFKLFVQHYYFIRTALICFYILFIYLYIYILFDIRHSSNI